MSFIFLEQPLSTRFPGVNSTSRCKVVFSSPKHRPMSPRVVHATVKNCYTLKVRVPRCPSEFPLKHVQLGDFNDERLLSSKQLISLTLYVRNDWLTQWVVCYCAAH